MKVFIFLFSLLILSSFKLLSSNVLIVNDDGICANVLDFAQGLSKSHKVTVVVPSL